MRRKNQPCLPQNHQVQDLFDQLELNVNKRRIATKALVSIATGAGVECLLVKTRADNALLQNTNEITFSDEDMEVGHSDHRRPLYLVASTNQIPIKIPLINTGTSVNLIPLGTLQAAGISIKKKKTRVPNRGNRIWGKR